MNKVNEQGEASQDGIPVSRSMIDDRPKVGVGVVVKKDNKVLLGKRKGSHAAGSWSFPGGHLEFNEEIFDCAAREVKEEAGISIKNLESGPYTNDLFTKDGKHYVTLYVISEWDSGDPKILEKDKCDEWGWFDPENLPKPLMTPIENLIKSGYKLP